jgi:hypothetical protein
MAFFVLLPFSLTSDALTFPAVDRTGLVRCSMCSCVRAGFRKGCEG